MARRTTPPKACKETTLSKVLWKIEQDYQEAARELKARKTELERELIEKYCPLPQKRELIVADYTHRGKTFFYEDFKAQYGNVLLYGPLVKKNGEDALLIGESRIEGDKVKLLIPQESE